MSTETKAYLVLHSEETREAFERAAAELGFVRSQTRAGDGQTKAYEQVWATADKSVAVNWVEDPTVQPRYLAIRAVQAGDADEYVTEFAARVSVEDREDAIELAAGAVQFETQVYGLQRLAIVFPSYDPRAFRVFEAYATEHPDPRVRENAIYSMCVRSWPECRSLLERVSTGDPDERVRAYADEVLSQWPQQD